MAGAAGAAGAAGGRLLAEVAGAAGAAAGAAAGEAAAGTDVAYDASKGSGIVEAAGGVLFLGLAAYFFVRTFSRRAKYATSIRLAARSEADETAEEAQARVRREAANRAGGSAVADPLEGKTPGDAARNGLVAAAFSVALYALAIQVDHFVADKGPGPDASYTAQRVGALLTTVTTGLVYFASFIFGANGLGLLGLAVQMQVAPESLKPEGAGDGEGGAGGE